MEKGFKYQYIYKELRLEIAENENKIIEKISNNLKINISDLKLIKILKKSVDSRHREDTHYKYNVVFSCNKLIKNNKKIEIYEEKLGFNLDDYFLENKNIKPLIIGSGPSGLFCAYILAKLGAKPIIIEQGKQARCRQKDVENFWNTGVLKLDSNVQFGHGGAGTFSDGKLNSGINNIFCEYVIKKFVEFGAKEEILYSKTPHVGSDVLIKVLENMQAEIEALGGKFLFEHKFIGFETVNGKIVSANISHNGEKIKLETDTIVLAIGHSSRDTFEMLHQSNINIVQKPLSIGLRIQHKQEDISMARYGDSYKLLPPADYKLSCFVSSGRCVYTFCNCPGGYVVNASSEENGTVCNGMSYSDRAGINCNSAVLVSVDTKDYESDHALAGMYFQRKYEQLAYNLTKNHNLPVQRFEDFEKNEKSKKLGRIGAECKGNFELANLNECLPEFARSALIEGIKEFDKKIKGFADGDAVLTGVETRSSSPIRILRDENFDSNIIGLKPCGEGAGYAGGILSASVDGVKVALSLCGKK